MKAGYKFAWLSSKEKMRIQSREQSQNWTRFTTISLGLLLLCAALTSKLGKEADGVFLWLTIGVDTAGILVTVVLSRWDARVSSVFLAILFLLFGSFHLINFGETCGCFGSGISNWFLISGNLQVFLGYVLLISNRRDMCRSGGILVALGISLLLFSWNKAEQTQQQVMNLCQLRGSQHPFVEATNASISAELQDGKCWIFAIDCSHCQVLANELAGTRWRAELETLRASKPDYILARQHLGEFSFFALSLPSEWAGSKKLIPCKFDVQDGLIENCQNIFD